MNFPVGKSIDSLFTFNFRLNADMSVSEASSRLVELCPALVDGEQLLEVFTCHRPVGCKTIEDINASIDSLFMLISHDRKLAIKGQFVDSQDHTCLKFFGMPWLAWMNDKAKDVHLQLSDYPKFDSQMDQVFYVTSQQAMVSDLEELNEKLIHAEAEAKEANRIQSDLFAVMSHEMRTPLNAVIGSLSLMSDENPAERTKLANIASQSAKNLLQVINYALDFSKEHAGVIAADSVDFAIEHLINSVEAVTQSRAEIKGLKFETQIDSQLPDMVCGDEGKLRQVLINLVGNAIKFTSTGKVTLSIRAAEHGNVMFTVADTGPGISSEDIEHVFEPFWSKTHGAAEHSTGLGLNIVKRLVDVMSGRVEVRSSLGSGSSFDVLVPLPRALTGVTPVRNNLVLDKLPRHFKGKVLLVDDNQTNLLLGTMLLEKLGVTVITASNGADAVEAALSEDLDLVLMDISMPGMDGVQAAGLINESYQAPPIVALTANVGPEVVKGYLASGFKSYLSKPVDNSELLYELNMWLQPSKPLAQTRVDPNHIVSNRFTLTSLVGQIGSDKFLKVRRLFCEETQTRLSSLLAAWVRRDLEGLRLEAHTLSSSVASFGCEDLAWRFKNIETAARNNDVAEIVYFMKDIDKAANESLHIIREFKPSKEDA